MSINAEASRMLARGPESFAVSDIGRSLWAIAKLVIIHRALRKTCPAGQVVLGFAGSP
jgi:hypothetical protein